jgi:hypothetical protein
MQRVSCVEGDYFSRFIFRGFWEGWSRDHQHHVGPIILPERGGFPLSCLGIIAQEIAVMLIRHYCLVDGLIDQKTMIQLSSSGKEA